MRKSGLRINSHFVVAIALAVAVVIAMLATRVHTRQSELTTPPPKAQAAQDIDLERDMYASMHLRKKTSCVSCEQQFAPDEKWRGQPTRCVDCEAQLASSPDGPAAAYMAS